ncbi:MAG TPA: class I SAM-dependent methyltransferase [Candidatus Polarisedimenticolia bacterium]|nr:class I SAM-dependent methyltransferase [Candidatus Polarisedimenticolia bacterium]
MASYRTYDLDSIEVDPGSKMFQEHVSRYWWAGDSAAGLDVLDCATGKGYGAHILAGVARSVLAVDLNPASLQAASALFGRPGLEFRAHDVLKLDELGRRFDLITAFEIIEHIPPETTSRFLEGLAACLRPGGRVLLSTPNHDVVVKSGSSIPEFHINNFAPAALRAALREHFEQVTMLGQFRRRGPLYGALLRVDRWNLRHLAARPVRPLLGWPRAKKAFPGPPPPSNPVPASDAVAAPAIRHGGYVFSPAHWRQAGLTVALCQAARARPKPPAAGA